MAEQTFTKEQLAQYDGKDGRKPYVAIDGIVYAMSDIGPWQGGEHHGHVAGRDLSAEIDSAPHKRIVIAHLTVVGKYIG